MCRDQFSHRSNKRLSEQHNDAYRFDPGSFEIERWGFLRNHCGILPTGTDFCGSNISATVPPWTGTPIPYSLEPTMVFMQSDRSQEQRNLAWGLLVMWMPQMPGRQLVNARAFTKLGGLV
jgi:hypothetical protein